ncbi:hypothetical protein [Colwellia psychrerythraea]|uniref:Uncharacterized protein n=1 Tax=Colwellia psychrerythraea TaxID=28229 RepID=A0A099KQJ9_COLPS|nr:hypothetical protein [Colwellia psychrerythraea]KGJ92142.1 hypothetical protein ND2E_3035 [Colwellia psychrerythraea]
MTNSAPALTPFKAFQHQLDLRIAPTAQLYKASKQVSLALFAKMQQPDDKFVRLCMHPCFDLLWQGHPSQFLDENLVMTVLQTFDTHDIWLALARLLKQALPDLAASFENEPGLAQVWILTCGRLLAFPLQGDPLAHFSAAQRVRLCFVDYQALTAT